MDLSIVIVNFNACPYLRRCLESLYACSPDPPEIVVVDNGSRDGSVAMVRKEFPKVRLLESRENLGFSAANNWGMRESRGAFILFLNPDVEVKPHGLERMRDFMQRHPEVGILGPRLIYPDGRFQLSAGRLPSLWQEFWDRWLYRRLERHRGFLLRQVERRFARIREVEWVTGACFLARRSVLEAVGGFDEHLFMYFEDKDLCKRVREAGYRVVYFPEATVVHLKAGSSGKSPQELDAIYRQSQRYYYRKHLGALSVGVLEIYLRLRQWRRRRFAFST